MKALTPYPDPNCRLISEQLNHHRRLEGGIAGVIPSGEMFDVRVDRMISEQLNQTREVSKTS